MSESKFLAFFDILANKKASRPSSNDKKKKAESVQDNESRTPSIEKENTPAFGSSESKKKTNINKLLNFYEDSVKNQGDISRVLDKENELIYYGEGEENSANINKHEAEKELILKADNFVEYLYEDNAILLACLPLIYKSNNVFKGIPTYTQYKKICTLTSDKVEQIEHEDHAKYDRGRDKMSHPSDNISFRRGDYIKSRLADYSYGYKGHIGGFTFTRMTISSEHLRLIERSKLGSDIASYKDLINHILNFIKNEAIPQKSARKETNIQANINYFIQNLPRQNPLPKDDFYIKQYAPFVYTSDMYDDKKTIYKKGYLIYTAHNDGSYSFLPRKNDTKHYPSLSDEIYWEYLRTHKLFSYYGQDRRTDYFLTERELKLRFNILAKPKLKHSVLLPRKEQESHSYIVGGTKSGKSELLKYLMVQEILKGDRNSILFDPHGDIADQIINIKFLYPETVKNIIYVDTSIKDSIGQSYENLPCINPLEVNRKYIDTREKLESVAYYLSLAFEEITGTENTVNMRAMLIPCLCVLLERKGSDLYDLDRFMDDERNDDLVQIGIASPNRSHASYFENKFLTNKTKTTKDALAIRLQVMLNSTVFSKMTCGKTTLDFHEIIRGSNNHVIFRLNKENTSAIQKELGILIITAIINAGFTTKERERIGTHLLVDEFQNFVSSDMETILSECRKYKIYMTMAHQYTDQIKDMRVKKAILSNTNIKIIGSVGGNTVSVLKNNGEEKLEQEFVDNLRTGKFLIRIKSQGAFYNYLNVPATVVNNFVKWVALSDKKDFLKAQYNRYYKVEKRPKPQTKKATKKANEDINFSDF